MCKKLHKSAVGCEFFNAKSKKLQLVTYYVLYPYYDFYTCSKLDYLLNYEPNHTFPGFSSAAHSSNIWLDE